MKKLSGKVAIVTGAGRGQGIGRACALRLAEEGADVAVADLSPEAGGTGIREAEKSGLRVLAEEIASRGSKPLVLEVDVTDLEAVERAVKMVKETYGRLDILVNNAGTAGIPAPLVQTDPADWQKTLAVNLTGTMYCCRAAAFLMMDNATGGKIINMSSRAAHRGAIWIHAYCASKAGIIGLTRSMALELAPFKICVNALCPGDIDTELKRWGWAKEGLVRGKSVEEMAQAAAAATPLGRVGLPEDVAAAVAFFASPDSDYLTGEVLNITGGNGMHTVF